jgi:hypothetical protein
MSRLSIEEYRAHLAGRGQPTQAAPAKGKPKPRTDTPSPTNALTKAVIDLLQLRGFRAWRQNNGAVYDASFNGYRANSATPGISDVLGYHLATGRFAAVEIKVGKDTLSPEQTAFLADVLAAGGFSCEGRSIAQVDQELTEYLSTLLP